jgi:transposase-like protein
MRETKKEVNLWLERRLDKHYLVLYIDATFVHTRRDESVSKEAYYSILGVKTDGTREVLAVVNHPTEGATNWENELNNLKTRGVETTNLVVSDALTGIENAVAKAFPGAEHQFCLVHLKRQLLSSFPLKSKEEIAKELKIVFPVGQEEITPCEAFLKYKAFIEKYEVKYKSLSSCKSDRYIHYFTYLNYPKEIQQMVYSTNWIERLNRDHKRVLKMRASLPNPEAVIFLMGSVAQERTETTYSYPIAAFKMPELKKIDRKVVEKKDVKKE